MGGCKGINGQTYLFSLDGYALIIHHHGVWVGGVSLSQVEAGGYKVQSTVSFEQSHSFRPFTLNAITCI